MYNLKVQLLLLRIIFHFHFCLSQFRRVAYGDDPPAQAAYPFTSQVLIKIILRDNNDPPKRQVFTCSGTVVAPRVVLTAGHCFEDNLPFKVRRVLIHYGQFINDKNITVAPASGWLQHPDYDYGVDLGVVTTIEPILIPCSDVVFLGKWDLSTLDNQRNTFMCGWGRDQMNVTNRKIKHSQQR